MIELEYFLAGVIFGMTLAFGSWILGQFLRARDLAKIEKGSARDRGPKPEFVHEVDGGDVEDYLYCEPIWWQKPFAWIKQLITNW